MPAITYNLGIPASGNNPSNDQPNLLTNTNAVNSILAVDHNSFSDTNAGTHAQVTLPYQNAGATQSGNSAVIYTAAGLANSSASQIYWKNSQGGASATPYQLSAVKAWATFSGASGSILGSQSLNVSSITRNSTGSYAVTLSTNALSGSSYGIILSSTDNASNQRCTLSYSILGATGFTISAVAAASGFALTDPNNVTFMVIQI